MSATLQEMEDGGRRPVALGLPRRAAIVAATILILTVLAPFGTQSLPLPRRMLHWALMVLVWEVAIYGVWRCVASWRQHRGLQSPVPGTSFRWSMAIVALAALPAAPLSLLTLYGHVPSLSACLMFTFNALVLGVIITLARMRLHAGSATVAASVPVPVPEAKPAPHDLPQTDATDRAFLLRHAPALAGGRLLALAAEDHYLRLHTDRGNALVLLRLRDAIEALGPARGTQVHRSYWVAADAAPVASRRGQAWQLTLPGNLAVPVSKANVAACRAAGWLPGGGSIE